ncbi:hypothetical protein HPB51_001094 [Rhipicephalus microplus]|uniref:Uncharacterized protein n=1 Tax=Rhipicephalus microplus TaxID=6941 RepID=A0A9J6D845_RHIMP|nr:hypothetical protein HPB51_001094 [Rhipicephalus microplus]
MARGIHPLEQKMHRRHRIAAPGSRCHAPEPEAGTRGSPKRQARERIGRGPRSYDRAGSPKTTCTRADHRLHDRTPVEDNGAPRSRHTSCRRQKTLSAPRALGDAIVPSGCLPQDAISDFTSNRYEESAKGRPRLVERTEAAFRRYPPNNSFACDYHPPRCCSRTCQRPNASEGGIRCAVACLHAVERTGPPERLVGGVRATRSLLPRMYLD